MAVATVLVPDETTHRLQLFAQHMRISAGQVHEDILQVICGVTWQPQRCAIAVVPILVLQGRPERRSEV